VRELSSSRLSRVGRLRSNVAMLGDRLHGSSRGINVSDVGLDEATALHAEDDEKNPGDELADTAESDHGNTAIPFAHVAIQAGVVVAAVVGVGARVAARVAGVEIGAHESTADDEEDDGGDEEADAPPFGYPLTGGCAVLLHGDGRCEGMKSRCKEKKSVREKWIGLSVVMSPVGMMDKNEGRIKIQPQTPEQERNERVLKGEQTLQLLPKEAKA
jgi:hypothetical protein